MNIDKKPTYTYTFTLTEEEMKWFKFCVDYAWHRAFRHSTPVTCYQNFLTELKDNINKIFIKGLLFK